MKQQEQLELHNICQNAFDAEMPTFLKRKYSLILLK